MSPSEQEQYLVIGKTEYVQAFHFDAYEIVRAAQRGLSASLPSCPGWTVAHLLGHLGETYVFVAKNIRVGKGQDVVHELEDLELAADFEEWFRRGQGTDGLPPNVVEWFAASAAALEDTFRESDPGDPAWSWSPTDQTAGFWIRRMAHETAVHRWDAQMGHGDADPIEVGLARDGIDEALDVYQPQMSRREVRPRGDGEVFHFQQTDGDGNWWVRFEGLDMEVFRSPLRPDVSLRGTSSDLELFLWHRISAKALEVEGDPFIADGYFELVPPD